MLLSASNALEAKKWFKENDVSGGVEPKDGVNGIHCYNSLCLCHDGARVPNVARALFSLGSLGFSVGLQLFGFLGR